MKIVLKEGEEHLGLTDEDLKGKGLTAQEIASSPEIGAWADEQAQSGSEYVEVVRRASNSRTP